MKKLGASIIWGPSWLKRVIARSFLVHGVFAFVSCFSFKRVIFISIAFILQSKLLSLFSLFWDATLCLFACMENLSSYRHPSVLILGLQAKVSIWPSLYKGHKISIYKTQTIDYSVSYISWQWYRSCCFNNFIALNWQLNKHCIICISKRLT